MARTSGVSAGGLVLPNAAEKYDAPNERETRRLIAQAMRMLPQWDALTNVPKNVTSLGTLSGAADMVPYFTGTSAMALASLTPYARTIIACATATAMRTALGLGPLAILALSGVATQFVNGSGAFAAVKGSDLSMADVTTNDVSITKHGFAPKAPNDATKFLDGTGAYSAPISGGSAFPSALPTFPTLSSTIQGRFSAEPTISTLTLNTDGRVAQLNDASGNWGSNFTATTTARPRWLKRAMNGSRPGIVFDGITAKMTAGATKTIAQPLTVVAVVQNWKGGAANGNIFRDSAGGPVAFLNAGNSWALFAGSSITSTALFDQNQLMVPDGMVGAPTIVMCVFNNASSILGNNGVEVTGTTGTTGISGTMKLGGDNTTSFAHLVLYEILFISGALSPTDRAAINTYYATALDINL